MEFPKVMYKGALAHDATHLGGLQTATVISPKEEKEQLKNGFVNVEDVESLRVKPADGADSEPAKGDKFDDMTVSELKAHLDKKKIEYSSTALRDDLLALARGDKETE